MSERKSSAALSAVSERKWQDVVIGVAKTHNWMIYHTHDSRKCTPGFPDLILVHPGKKRLVVAELKTVSGQLDAAQQLWLKAFTSVTTRPQVYVWRPGDLEEVNEALGGLQ
jgi:hypothetical protein